MSSIIPLFQVAPNKLYIVVDNATWLFRIKTRLKKWFSIATFEPIVYTR